MNVVITDPINQIQGDRKVDNVPFGLAFMGHTISSLGNWLTDVFGMNFALPNDLQYNKNGMLFGSTLIKDTFNSKISDQTTYTNFSNYIRQCVIPGVNLKRVDIKKLIQSVSIQDFLNYGKNGVLAYNYTNNNNIETISLCNNTSEITKDINTEIDKIIKNQNNTFNKTGNSNLNEINNYVLSINQSTTKTLEQNLIANAISDTTQEYLSITGADAGATNYAITKDDIQKKQNGILQWLQAGKFLPLLKIVIEVMFYSLFPIIILLTMLPNGWKIFKAYIFILISLQLWSPLYAILNLIMTLEQKYRLSSLIKQTGSQISLYNKQAIIDVASNIQTQAGVLAFCIPVLASKIVSGMQGFGEGMISGMSSSGAYSTSQVVSEVASGNLNYGNTSLKNMSLENESFNNITGNNTSKNKHDTMSFERGSDGYGVSANRYVSAPKDDLGIDVTRTERKSVSIGKNLSSAENVLKAKSQDRSNAESDFNSYASSHRNDIIKSVNESDVISDDDKKHITASLGANASAGFKLFGNGAKVEAKTEAAWGRYLSHTKNISENTGSNDVIATEISKRHDRVMSTTRAEREATTKRQDYTNALASDAQITRNINNETFENLTPEEKKLLQWNILAKKTS